LPLKPEGGMRLCREDDVCERKVTLTSKITEGRENGGMRFRKTEGGGVTHRREKRTKLRFYSGKETKGGNAPISHIRSKKDPKRTTEKEKPKKIISKGRHILWKEKLTYPTMEGEIARKVEKKEQIRFRGNGVSRLQENRRKVKN